MQDRKAIQGPQPMLEIYKCIGFTSNKARKVKKKWAQGNTIMNASTKFEVNPINILTQMHKNCMNRKHWLDKAHWQGHSP